MDGGAGPVRASNPGTNRTRGLLEDLNEKIDRADYGRHANADLPGHPELAMDDYRRLPALLERPDFVFRAKPHRSTAKGTLDRRWNLAGQVGGRAYHAVIERDAAARKVEVISFHRIEPRKIRSMLKRADSFREEKREWDCAW